jgi:hypothetical protein
MANKKYFIECILTEKELEEVSVFLARKADSESNLYKVLFKVFNSCSLISEQDYRCNTIVFDLDGTICQMSKSYPSIGKVYPAVKPIIDRLRGMGFKIGVYTARANKERKNIKEYLLNSGIDIDFVNCENKNRSSKPLAGIYVDDRGFRFSGRWARDESLLLEYINILFGVKEEE